MIRVAGCFILCIGFIGTIKAQSPVDVNVAYAKGFILEHAPSIAHLTTSHPTSLWLSLYKKSYGEKQWQTLYNYPDVGATLLYMDYHNPVLGKSIGLIPNHNFHFLHPGRRVNGHFKIGLGFAYHTNPYDKVENNKNNVLSTHFSYGILFQSEATAKITDQLKFATGVSYTHFSNGSVKKPNKGINIISWNTGITYTLGNILDYKDDVDKLKVKSKWQTVAVVSGGVSETIKIRSGTYPFFNALLYADRSLNIKRRAGGGIEYFHTLSLREEIKIDPAIEGKRPDFRRIALVAVYEQVFNAVSLIANSGIYIYRPYKAFDPFYLRIGVRYALNDHMFAGLTVKSHFFKAEAGEWSIGYRF